MSKLATVLHVDDSEDDRILLRYALGRSQNTFVLQSVSDGHVAIEYLKGVSEYHDRERFALPVLILLDIKMPGMNGFDVLEWVRKQPVLKDIAVAILSSSYDSADVTRAYALGAKWYLMKAVDYDDVKRLVDLVREWLIDPKTNDLSRSPYFKPEPNEN
jgi:CheY-like chemotaxis protein